MSAAIARFPAFWPLDSFSALEAMRARFQPGAKEITRYPIKYLRYWFVRNFLEFEARRLGRPLNVLEVGVDRGQMLAFMGHPLERARVVGTWTAIDVAPNEPWLRNLGYTDVVRLNVDRGADPSLVRRYDAMIFLHVLEHLETPESTLRAFAKYLPKDGIVVGGSPTMPSAVADLGYERRLRRKAKPFGHVSVISPERIERFAESEGMSLDFLSGAYFARKQGAWIENSPLWLRFNIAFGALLPSLGSEVYFKLTKK